MNKFLKFVSVVIVSMVALMGWGCNIEYIQRPKHAPTLSIVDPKFDAETKTAKVTVVPSSDTQMWYYKIEEDGFTHDIWTKVDGADAKEIEFDVCYGVEYVVSAYAITKWAESDIATQKICPTTEGRLYITMDEIALVDEENLMAEVLVAPSEIATKWYWKSNLSSEWECVEGNTAKSVSFKVILGANMTISAYAMCDSEKSVVVEKDFCLKSPTAKLTISNPRFDEQTMTLSLDVEPSQDTAYWQWGINHYPLEFLVENNERCTISIDVEYGEEYTLIFLPYNKWGIKGVQENVSYSLPDAPAEN